MKLTLWYSPNVRTIQCRRGSNVYRVRELQPHETKIEYPVLPNCVVELVEAKKVVGKLEVQFNVPTKGILKDVRPPQEDGRNLGSWVEAQNPDLVQQVGTKLHSDGETLRGTAGFSLSSVDRGNARQRVPDERGTEVGSDGLHSSNDAPIVPQDRPATGIGTVPATK